VAASLLHHCLGADYPLVIVAAVARNRVIGRDNFLAWTMRSDLAHFRSRTMGRPLIMGHRTWLSIGRSLPGRRIIIVSHHDFPVPDSVFLAHDPDSALSLAKVHAADMNAPEIILAGGAGMYAALMPHVTRMVITEVDLSPDGDCFFPPIDSAVWNETARVPHKRGAGDDASFSIVEYQRRSV
jgi:dihydrofolate reductase